MFELAGKMGLILVGFASILITSSRAEQVTHLFPGGVAHADAPGTGGTGGTVTFGSTNCDGPTDDGDDGDDGGGGACACGSD